ncbi:unnamed protein product, partial [Meganyctiphanes norvegica]
SLSVMASVRGGDADARETPVTSDCYSVVGPRGSDVVKCQSGGSCSETAHIGAAVKWCGGKESARRNFPGCVDVVMSQSGSTSATTGPANTTAAAAAGGQQQPLQDSSSSGGQGHNYSPG